MKLTELLQDVDDRAEELNLAIDADSILYLSSYKYRDNWDMELAYFDFVGRVTAITREAFNKAQMINETVLCFTSKTNFRYDIYPSYKANRDKKQDNEAVKLREYVKRLKKLVYTRVKPMCNVNAIVEADDLCVMYSHKGYLISAFDKDVISQCVTPVLNYKTMKWAHDGLTTEQINMNSLIQSIQGDTTDNIKGVNRMGAVKATNFVEALFDGLNSFDDYVSLFTTPEDMLLSNRLVNMSQYKSGELVMLEVKDIANMIPVSEDTF